MKELSRLGRAVRAGLDSDPAFGSVVPPLYGSSNFSFAGLGEPRSYDYTRSGNPTRDLLASAISTLEGGVGGVITATGMAAVTLVTELVPTGGRVLIPHDCYGGTWRLLTYLGSRGRIVPEFVDMTAPGALAAAGEAPFDMILIETPSNPLLRITDIRAAVALAHRHGAIAVADNTFCSPLLQQPLDLGCDLVLHSTTKFINGHSDVVGGAVIAKADEHLQSIKEIANNLGITASPYDSHLTMRGLRTIAPRVRTHCENAEQVAALLDGHPAVARVNYPGLASHPGHELAATQQQGWGSLISFDLAGGYEAVRRLLPLRCFTLAESLGGVESLIAHPATMTHASMSAEARAEAGIGEGLLRLSVGIEPVDDLLGDLEAGLDRAA